jgi:hypothetical protein
MEQDHAGMMAAHEFMRNAQGLATATDEQQGRGIHTNTAAYLKKSLEAQLMEQPTSSASSGGKRSMEGLEAGWNVVGRDERRTRKDDGSYAGPKTAARSMFPGPKLTDSTKSDRPLQGTASQQLASPWKPQRQYGTHPPHRNPHLQHNSRLPPRAPEESRAPRMAPYEALDSSSRRREIPKRRRHTGYGAQYYRRPTLNDGPLPPPPPPPPAPPSPPPAPRPRRKVVVENFKRRLVPRDPEEDL